MRNRYAVLSLCLTLLDVPFGRAAVLPPEKLLPKDTVAVITAPDTPKFLNVATNSTLGRLWRALEMKPFRDRFEAQAKESLGGPMEKDFGIKLEDLANLAQGQTTLAILPNSDGAKPGDRFAPVLLVDAKDRADQLKKMLDNVKKKWADAGKTMKTSKIHDFDFTTFVSDASPTSQPKPDGASDTPPADGAAASSSGKTEIFVGQVDSLLVASSSSAAIDKILSRREGGLVPALEEQPAFQTDLNTRLRASPAYLWVNVKEAGELFGKPSDDPIMPGSVNFPAILSATGLSDITSASLTFQRNSEGATAQLFVAVPEANRRGLLKAFALETKDSSPPPFVPADAIKFLRWRVNLRQSWETLEKMLNDINPNFASLVNFVLSSAGKDKDEKYDLKAELLDNLGDDVISYAKAPKGNTLEDFKAPPGLMLIGSPNPDKLAEAVKVALGSLAQTTGGVKEQEFLGRKIFSLAMPGQQRGDSNPLSFAASGSYVAFSAQSEMVQEFLRSNEGASKPLSGTEGLASAAQKIGGMETGFFEYDNYVETAKSVFNLTHSDNVTLTDVLGAQKAPGLDANEQLGKMKDWADFSLLPPFDSVSKYFYFGVQSMRFTPDGFSFTIFTPTPPKLR